MQQIIHNIPLIGQEREGQTLSTSLAMMLSWKSGKKQSFPTVNDSIPSSEPRLSFSDPDLLFDSVNEIMINQGMILIRQWPFNIDDLSMIIFQSPVLAAFFSDGNNRLVYALVITGLMGDGTLNNTFVHIQDPDLYAKGKIYKMSLGDFYQQFSKVVSTNDHLDLEKATAKFWYFNAAPVLNVTSTHSSVSSSSQTTEVNFETSTDKKNGNKDNSSNDNSFDTSGNMPF